MANFLLRALLLDSCLGGSGVKHGDVVVVVEHEAST